MWPFRKGKPHNQASTHSKRSSGHGKSYPKVPDAVTGSEVAYDEHIDLDLDLELEEDISAELEDFIFLARLGAVDDALALVQNVLWRHTRYFPVFAEVASFLVDHCSRDDLVSFMEDMRLQRIIFTDYEEREFAELLFFFAQYETGVQSVQSASQNEKELITSLSSMRTSHNNTDLSPVKVHIIELRFKFWAIHSPASSHIVSLVYDHFQNLVEHGLNWEAAQIFGVVCSNDHLHDKKFKLNMILMEARMPGNNKSVITDFYRKLMTSLDEKALLNTLSREFSGPQLENQMALALLSAKLSLLRLVDIPDKRLSQYRHSRILDRLRDEIKKLLEVLFAQQTDPKPRGKYFEKIMEFGSQTELASFDRMSPLSQTRTKSSIASKQATSNRRYTLSNFPSSSIDIAQTFNSREKPKEASIISGPAALKSNDGQAIEKKVTHAKYGDDVQQQVLSEKRETPQEDSAAGNPPENQRQYSTAYNVVLRAQLRALRLSQKAMEERAIAAEEYATKLEKQSEFEEVEHHKLRQREREIHRKAQELEAGQEELAQLRHELARYQQKLDERQLELDKRQSELEKGQVELERRRRIMLPEVRPSMLGQKREESPPDILASFSRRSRSSDSKDRRQERVLLPILSRAKEPTRQPTEYWYLQE